MSADELAVLAEWCHEHEYFLIAVYHESPRIFLPMSVWQKYGRWYMSAHDHTHKEEAYTRTYFVDGLRVIGIGRRGARSLWRAKE